MKQHVIQALVAGGLAVSATPVTPGEETLSFRLVTHDLSEAVHDEPAIEGLSLSASQAVGVAIFEDGRIAYKEYVALAFAGEGAPERQPGYSSYMFENGDSLQLSFVYGPGEGSDWVVEYTVLSGTGAYAGATGTGQLSILESPWQDAGLLEGSLQITTP